MNSASHQSAPLDHVESDSHSFLLEHRLEALHDFVDLLRLPAGQVVAAALRRDSLLERVIECRCILGFIHLLQQPRRELQKLLARIPAIGNLLADDTTSHLDALIKLSCDATGTLSAGHVGMLHLRSPLTAEPSATSSLLAPFPMFMFRKILFGTPAGRRNCEV